MQALEEYISIEVEIFSPKWHPALPRVNQTWDPNTRKLVLVRFHVSLSCIKVKSRCCVLKRSTYWDPSG